MTFRMFKDDKREWRWHLVAKNGKLVAASGEGYKRQGKCRRTIERIILNIHEAEIETE